MDAFPALTIIAQVETKKEMDRFGPGSLQREEKDSYANQQTLQKMLATGKLPDGRHLSEDDKKEVKAELARLPKVIEELKNVQFQSATLTFDRGFSVDLGNREVQVKFLGRGNTPGYAVAYLPEEKILIAGDLVDHPLPNVYDGYPAEWIHTLESLAQLDANTVVPGHGPILHDKTYIYLLRDLMQSAVEQVMSGGLKKAPEPPEPEERRLTASQQKWNEYRLFSEQNDMRACRARAAKDPGYANYIHKTNERDFAATQDQVPDAVINLNVKAPATTKFVSQEVTRFVEDYRTMPIARIKLMSSPGTNPAGVAGAQHWSSLFTQACNAGLI